MQPGGLCVTSSTRLAANFFKQGLLTVEKKGKKNVFSGRDETEGLPKLRTGLRAGRRHRRTLRQRLHRARTKEPIIEYIQSKIVMLKWMIARLLNTDARTIRRRIKAMEDRIANPSCLAPDADAEYAPHRDRPRRPSPSRSSPAPTIRRR